MSEPDFLPEHFINRELSWLDFNARVLEEAQDESNPLLERAKFLAIFSSNLDEFFMVRVAGLREQAFSAGAPQDPPTDGTSPIVQLQQIAYRTRQLVERQYDCWNQSIAPALAAEGIRLHKEADLESGQVKQLDKFFRQRVFPVLTPMAIDPAHPSPRFHNRGLYLAATLNRYRGIGPEKLFAVVQLPQVLPRYVPLDPNGGSDFVLLEDIVANRLTDLFGGYDLNKCGAFRMTRDMDIDLLDEEGDDMLRAIETRLRARQRSEAVRLEASAAMDASLVNMLAAEEEIKRGRSDDPQDYDEVYSIDGPLDMTSLFELGGLLDRPDLRDPTFTPRMPPQLGGDMFAAISKEDVLLHHPFESFQPVVRFIQQAAVDPNVLAIKQTLYRTSGDSPIISALIEAAEAGKHVTAVVELKARFDEAANISWARRMERAGVHVVFGFMDLKTHSKLALVVRHEGGKRVRQYAHLGTGNYNPTTARLYTDIGLFTADKALTEDVAALFNFLTGYSQRNEWQKLVSAPQDLHRRTLELIENQTQRAAAGKKARIFGKFNSLVDRETINALYRASQAGVQVDLVIRGICCLRPGEPGVSDNIRVRSIVDRFLEHSRIMVFGVGDQAEVYCSSADWMPRNFNRRVEVMFPVEAPPLRQRILEEIIPIYLRDNQRARVLQPEGTFVRVTPDEGEPLHRSQQELLALASGTPLPNPSSSLAVAGSNGPPARREKKPDTRKRPTAKSSAPKRPGPKRRSKSE
ncbi:Polyphosphate kinase [Posidoniimonas polymericola]|uniref:Polyphosphate kinase n=1 Tax=Posidoniimonas polymericola TaxID=2528002 RepID=A0A5C5YIB8_9BACT|nr:polyphosphate kinase 1 [Posidoniimonas polymericola]TWT74612.1 Polyphosphate kinase [Posidoniimonas polymericola]